MKEYLNKKLFQLKWLINLLFQFKWLIFLIVSAIIFGFMGLIKNIHFLYFLGLIFSLSSVYLLAIWWEKIKLIILDNKEEKLDIKHIIEWKTGIGGIIRVFIIILILMSIGRLSNVIIYESLDSVYPFIISNNTSLDSVNPFIISDNKEAFKSFFSNLQPDYIRSEIGRILFLVILISVFSLVSDLIRDKPDPNQIEETKTRFCHLIITSLILALILTLSPEGDIGTITFNISIGTAVVVLILIISFILVYLFMNSSIKEIKDWLNKH